MMHLVLYLINIGCPEVEQELFEILNGNKISFQAYCIQGDTAIKFELNLPLFADVLKLRSLWGVTSANKFHATLMKSSSTEWESLLKEGFTQPNNMQKWFEMEEKFKDKKEEEDKDQNEDEDNSSKEDEDLEDEEVEETPKKKKRKTPKIKPMFGV
jgi:hypothetical protein